MAVQAKFYVRQITSFANAPDQVQVELSPVTRGEENREWAQATPSGNISLYINNPPAAQVFKDALGKEFFVTFEQA